MIYQPATIYHIYNQGNNREQIFFSDENYLFFLYKIRKHLLDHVDILCYCLMPNHFHLLVYTKPDLEPTAYLLNNGINILLRSYTRAINNQEGRTGSLFRQHTKAKNSTVDGYITVNGKFKEMFTNEYSFEWNCFHYIHENPAKVGIVESATDWAYSSAMDYAGLRNGTLCNQQLAKRLIPGLVRTEIG